MKLKLRKPQHEAVVETKAAYDEGLRRLLIVLPTGMGKTPTFASLRSFFGFKKRCLILVHMDELATQAQKKVQQWNPGDTVGVEMGKRTCLPTDTFVVASVQTLDGRSRLQQFNPDDFDLVICDEAHHSVAASWKRVLNHFGFADTGENLTDILLVGVTATPGRGDKQAMGQVYEKIAYQYAMEDAVRDGWLVMPKGYRVDTGDSLAGVGSGGEDGFNNSELAGVVDNLRRNQLAVHAYEKYGEGLRAIMFCVDIEHAKHAAVEFNKSGIPSAAVWGVDPERDEKMQAHKDGLLQVLTNVNVLTEGYDDPKVGVVINGAPTKSQLRFIQRAGRCFRLQAGIDNLVEAKALGYGNLKEYGIVIDLVDSTEVHSLATLPTIFGLPAGLDLAGMEVIDVLEEFEKYGEKYPDIDFSELKDFTTIEAHAHAVDLFSTKLSDSITAVSKLQWYRTPDGAYILRLHKTREHLEVVKSLRNNWVASGTINGSYFIKDGWPTLEAAIQFADGMVSNLGIGLIGELRRDSKVGKSRSSPAQMCMLRSLTPPELRDQIPERLTTTEAARIIAKLIDQKIMGTGKR